MLNAKKLLKMVRKWQKFAALGRRRITSAAAAADRSGEASDERSCSFASRGHVYVYTADSRRFMVPLKYLSSAVFVELFKMSEDEFGLPADGPITLPCDGACMEKVVTMLGRRFTRDAERSVLASIRNSRCAASFVQNGLINQQPVLLGF